GGGRVVAQGSGRNLGDSRPAGLDRARAHDSRICAARGGGVLHGGTSFPRGGARVVARTLNRMSGIGVGFVIFGVMLMLMVLRVPIGIAMFIVGACGYAYLTGTPPALLNSLKNLGYARVSNYDLVVIP